MALSVRGGGGPAAGREECAVRHRRGGVPPLFLEGLRGVLHHPGGDCAGPEHPQVGGVQNPRPLPQPHRGQRGAGGQVCAGADPDHR